jgi:predicted SnoaL-like aldol condensation-catalyzing enzyme
MDSKKDRMISASKGGGVFQGLTTQIKLIVRLLADRRVNPLVKLLPIGSLVYLVVPDIMVGPLDDAAIIWLGTYLFVELCPPEVVKEHKDALNRTATGEIPDPLQDTDAEIVDAEFWEEGKKP